MEKEKMCSARLLRSILRTWSLYPDDGHTNSQWQLKAVSGSDYNIVSRYDGQYMDVNGDSTSDSAAIVQWSSNGGTDQQWQIIAD